MHIYEAAARFESQLGFVRVRVCIFGGFERNNKNKLKLYGDAFIRFVQIWQIMMLLSHIMTTGNFRQVFLLFFSSMVCAILINFVVFQFSNKF